METDTQYETLVPLHSGKSAKKDPKKSLYNIMAATTSIVPLAICCFEQRYLNVQDKSRTTACTRFT